MVLQRNACVSLIFPLDRFFFLTLPLSYTKGMTSGYKTNRTFQRLINATLSPKIEKEKRLASVKRE